jgi:hypothetical protein
MAPRLRPVRRAFANKSSSSSHWKAWCWCASPRRLALVLLLVVALYVVYFAPAPYNQQQSQSGNSPKSLLDISINTLKDTTTPSNDAPSLQKPPEDATDDDDDDQPDSDDSVDKNDDDNDDNPTTTEEGVTDGNGAIDEEENHEVVDDKDLPSSDTGRDNDITNTDSSHHRVAGLSCEAYGGPSDDEQATREMVYWRDIPEDADFESPLKHESNEQFLTFEPDEGGWSVGAVMHS